MQFMRIHSKSFGVFLKHCTASGRSSRSMSPSISPRGRKAGVESRTSRYAKSEKKAKKPKIVRAKKIRKVCICCQSPHY